MPVATTLNDLRYQYYAQKLGIPLNVALTRSLNDLEYEAIATGALDSGGATGAPSGPAGGALQGTYPNPDLNPAIATSQLALFTAIAKGIVPASGGGSVNFLRADGSWSAPVASSSGTGLVQTPVKTSNYTAQVNDDVLINTSSSSVTVTLPSNPANGSQVRVRNVNAGSGTNNGLIGAGSGDSLAALSVPNLGLASQSWAWLIFNSADRTWYATCGINFSQTPLNRLAAPNNFVDLGNQNIRNLADPQNPQDSLNLRTADARYPKLTMQAVQTGDFTCTANSVYPINTQSSSVTATVPSGLSDGTQLIFVASNLVTTPQVNLSGGEVFSMSGPNKYIYRAGQTLHIIKSGTTWYSIEDPDASLATNVSFTPTGNIANNNVQLALQELDSEKQPVLTPTSVKTSNYTLQANEIARADTSSSAFTFTLPSAPAPNTVCGAILVTAGNTLTVSRGGTDVFDKVGGATTITLTNAGQVLLAEYSSADGVWLVTVRPAPSLNDGTYTYLDTGTPGVVRTQLNDEIGASSLILLDGMTKIMSCDYLQTTAMPACTYSNGSLGVGATLTATANGTAPVVDSITPALGDTVLLIGQATVSQNGLYNWTDLGSASTPWVLTKDNNADQAPEFTNGVTVVVARGNLHGGRWIRFKGMTYTMGTTGFNAQSAMTVGDLFAGPDRTRLPIVEDFGQFNGTVAMTSSAVHIPGVRGFFVGSGGAGEAVVQADITVGGGELVDGCAGLQTGTTATGRATYSSHASLFFDVTKRYELYTRLKVPTVSDGTQTFNVKFGLMDTTDGNPANGLYWEAISGSANWQCQNRAAGVNTTIDSGVAYNNAIRSFLIIVPGDGKAYFYNGLSLVATHTTGFMAVSTSVQPSVVILKSVGTTMREVRIDVFSADVTQQRSLFVP